MPDIGVPELLIIALVVFLLFGAQRLPKLSRSLGQSIRGFKQGLDEDDPLEDEEQSTAATAGQPVAEAQEQPVAGAPEQPVADAPELVAAGQTE